MAPIHPSDPLEHQIAAWRTHLARSPAVSDGDAAELEDHLREQIESLVERGLSADEAFLVGVKRIGAIDQVTREFAQEHSDRLWKQLVLPVGTGTAGAGATHSTLWPALGLAAASAVAMKLPALFGVPFDPDRSLFYPLNIALLTLPFVVSYFAWDRTVDSRRRIALASAFALAALLVNWMPFGGPTGVSQDADTLSLTIIHLPIALWLLVGVAYVGGAWRGNDRRMDFLRFTGEYFIYLVLIAMGGGVLTGLTSMLFQAIGLDVEWLAVNWIIPAGIGGAVVVAAWLVEAKQSVIENMAPVLARMFVPLFTLLLLAFLATMVVTGRGINVERDVLIAVDMLLVLVFGMLLYSISARDPMEPPVLLDWVQLTLVATALAVDVLALGAIGSRISEMGWTPNRTAALGMNVVLLVNLIGAAILYLAFLRGRSGLGRLWGWETTYLYVIGAWVAFVAFAFPPLFGFE